MDRDSRGRMLSEDRADLLSSGALFRIKEANTVRRHTGHLSLSISDVSEDADGASMSQTADEPFLYVPEQFLKTGSDHTDHKETEVHVFISP